MRNINKNIKSYTFKSSFGYSYPKQVSYVYIGGIGEKLSEK